LLPSASSQEAPATAWPHACKAEGVHPVPFAFKAFNRPAATRVPHVVISPYVSCTKNEEHDSIFEHNAWPTIAAAALASPPPPPSLLLVVLPLQAAAASARATPSAIPSHVEHGLLMDPQTSTSS
jgi:hypothetical protein